MHRARFTETRSIFNTPNPRLMNVSLLSDRKSGSSKAHASLNTNTANTSNHGNSSTSTGGTVHPNPSFNFAVQNASSTSSRRAASSLTSTSGVYRTSSNPNLLQISSANHSSSSRRSSSSSVAAHPFSSSSAAQNSRNRRPSYVAALSVSAKGFFSHKKLK